MTNADRQQKNWYSILEASPSDGLQELKQKYQRLALLVCPPVIVHERLALLVCPVRVHVCISVSAVVNCPTRHVNPRKCASFVSKVFLQAS